VKTRLSDELIATAMEMFFGCGYSWQKVADTLGLERRYLRDQVQIAKTDGMIKYATNTTKYRGLHLAVAMQRKRLTRNATMPDM
jgi:DNA-binding transcriptional regulator LsrR (DeoR family)